MSARTTGHQVLGIETSCDETAAAVVRDGVDIVSSVVASQNDVHARYGGVVPELAGRAHMEILPFAVRQALDEAEATGSAAAAGSPPVDAVAATVGPGLVGSLLVGLSFAKALSMAWRLPFVAVNHLEGHLFASLVLSEEVQFPLVVLLVSGGHTMLVSVEGLGRYRLLGQTQDDAAGEAFDKVARFLDLGYPGGPAIDRSARDGDPEAFSFPRPLVERGYDFSFSGLKTAVVRAVERRPEVSSADVAASFQAAVVDVLVAKVVRAAGDVGARGVCLGGGVAANSLLRSRVQESAARKGWAAHLPTVAMCTDNAAMVGAAGWWRLIHDGPSPLSSAPEPSLSLPVLS